VEGGYVADYEFDLIWFS